MTIRLLSAFDNGDRYLLDFGTCAALARLDHAAVDGWNRQSTKSGGATAAKAGCCG